MLDVLLALSGILGWSTEEPVVPPSPPLPILVAPAVTDEANAPPEWRFLGFKSRFPFGCGILIAGQLTAAEIPAESEPRSSEAMRELAAWAARTNRSNRLRFRFVGIHYDDVFGVEKRTEGTVTIDRDRARIEMVPANVEPGAINLDRSTKRGVHFKIAAGEAASIIFDGKGATYQEGKSRLVSVPLPPPWQVDSPFLFAPFPPLRFLEPFQEFEVTERARSFDVELGHKNKPGEQVHLVLKGRYRAWKQEFSRVEILLRANTYEPIAVRWIDSGDMKETVYIYSDIRRE